MKIHFATEARHCGLEQVFRVIRRELYGIRDRVQMINSDLASTIKSVCYPDRVNAAVQQRFALFKKSAGENFVVVSPRLRNEIIAVTHQLHQWFHLQSRRPGSWIVVLAAWRSGVQPPSD